MNIDKFEAACTERLLNLPLKLKNLFKYMRQFESVEDTEDEVTVVDYTFPGDKNNGPKKRGNMDKNN